MLVFRGETPAVPREKKSLCATSFTINPTKNWFVMELVPPRSETYSNFKIFFESFVHSANGITVNGTSVLVLYCVCYIWCLDYHLFRPVNSFN